MTKEEIQSSIEAASRATMRYIRDRQDAHRLRDWTERMGSVLHYRDDGLVHFGYVDSRGDPTMAVCSKCGQRWIKANGWMPEEPSLADLAERRDIADAQGH